MTFRSLAFLSSLDAIGIVTDTLRIHRPTILCLHSVTPAAAAQQDFRSALSFDIDALCALVERWKARRVPVIGLHEALDRLRLGHMAPFVVLTFDDGYRDLHQNLFRPAVANDIPFTVFVTTGLVDRAVPMWWDTLERLDLDRRGGRAAGADERIGDPALVELAGRFRRADVAGQRTLIAALARDEPASADPDPYDAALTWDMLREMATSPLVTIGAHSVRHAMLSSLARDDLLDELARSRADLERELGVAVRLLAYPFGQRDEVGPLAADAAREAGYHAAFTTEGRPLAATDARDPFGLPRILLSRKAQKGRVADAYLSGIPAAINQLAGRGSWA